MYEGYISIVVKQYRIVETQKKIIFQRKIELYIRLINTIYTYTKRCIKKTYMYIEIFLLKIPVGQAFISYYESHSAKPLKWPPHMKEF